MTRLSDAFERAHRLPAEVTPLHQPVERSHDEVLRLWHFDTDAQRTGASLGRRPSGKTDAPAATTARFPDEVQDKIILGEHVEPGLVEQYRRVGAALHHAQTQRGVRSVMIASAVAAEGKTLTTTNLALTLSHSFDRRVLLIDADLRRPSVHKMFGLPNDEGLLDCLKVQGGGRLLVHPVSRNLWVLTAGRPTSDPMGDLVSDLMKQLLVDAMEQFDWVIIDTPPVALMPDANLLAGMIDAALLVVSAGTTPYPLVQRATAAIGSERILGVVLNRADRAGLAHEYGYYYGYADRSHAAPKKRFGRRSSR